jgi:hypothetical protein
VAKGGLKSSDSIWAVAAYLYLVGKSGYEMRLCALYFGWFVIAALISMCFAGIAQFSTEWLTGEIELLFEPLLILPLSIALFISLIFWGIKQIQQREKTRR